jgi:ATP-dependent Clp protease ATP-binding subunit ClpC
MFERYTERARRVLFFARYESSQFGSFAIESEHVLLGLIREGKGLTSRIFALVHTSLESIRREIESRTAVHDKKTSTSVEIPFTAETKRILQFAAEEADSLTHAYIGTEHLLLGILREERCLAARILMEKGLRINVVRGEIVRLLKEPVAPTPVSELTRCCFCGEPLPADGGAALVVYPRPGNEGSQTLYTHRECLRTRVPPGVPLITDSDDDDLDLFDSSGDA